MASRGNLQVEAVRSLGLRHRASQTRCKADNSGRVRRRRRAWRAGPRRQHAYCHATSLDYDEAALLLRTLPSHAALSADEPDERANGAAAPDEDGVEGALRVAQAL